MKVKSDLYFLIESLTKSEKGYFKKFSQIHGEGNNSYTKLFDKIENDILIESAYAKKSNKNSIQVNKNAVTENYLYKVLLRALTSFKYNNSVSRKLKDELLNFDTLNEKKLFSQSYKLLQKIKELAIKYERFNLLIQIIDYELNFPTYIIAKNFHVSHRISELLNEQKTYMKKIENLSKYKALLKNLQYIVTIEHILDKETIKKVKPLVNNVILTDESKALSFIAKLHYNRIWKLYYLAIMDIERGNFYCRRILELYDNNLLRKEEDILFYIQTLQSLIFSYIKLKDFKKVNTNLNNFNELLLKYKNIIPTIGMVDFKKEYYILLFQFLSIKFDFKKLYEIANEAESFFKDNYKYIHLEEALAFKYNLVNIYIFFQDFKKALLWSNSYRNTYFKTTKYIDHQCNIRLLNIIIHFELGNYGLLKSLVSSTLRFFQKNNRYYGFEKIVLTFFKEIISKRNRNKIDTLFSKFINEVDSIKDDYMIKKSIIASNIYLWFLSKFQKKNMQQVYIENKDIFEV